MIVFVEKKTCEEWAQYSEQAHLICFGTHKPVSLDRFDFTLVARTEENLMGYVTCREIDADTLYWQFGGAFPGTRQTVHTWRVFQSFINYCKDKYRRVTMLIENTNSAMLKIAAKGGFKIIGCRFFDGAVLLEHLLEFSNA